MSKFSPRSRPAELWRGVSAGERQGAPSKFTGNPPADSDTQTCELMSRHTFNTIVELLEQEVCLKLDTSVKDLKYAWIFIIIATDHTLSFVSINSSIISYK